MKTSLVLLTSLMVSTSAIAVSEEFTSRDLDNDGKLTVEEWIGNKKNATDPKWIKQRTKTHTRLDKDGDGFISEQEWADRNAKK